MCSLSLGLSPSEITLKNLETLWHKWIYDKGEYNTNYGERQDWQMICKDQTISAD